MQNSAKIISKEPAAMQTIFTDCNEKNLEVTNKTNPARKAGIIKGNPSFKIDILTPFVYYSKIDGSAMLGRIIAINL
jgi:hypothetical protein